MKTDLYKQNQSLSTRLLNSIILYLDDMTNLGLNHDMRQQSKAAVLTLLDSALVYMNDGLTDEARQIVERIFQRVIYDVVKEDLAAINKDMKTLAGLKNIFI